MTERYNYRKTKYINTQYKPAELEAAIEVLTNNHYHNFSPEDAKGIVLSLHRRGFRIIKAGKQE